MYLGDLHNFNKVGTVLELRHKYNQDGSLGFLKLRGQTPVVIPAFTTVVLEGIVNYQSSHSEKWALMGLPSNSSLMEY